MFKIYKQPESNEYASLLALMVDKNRPKARENLRKSRTAYLLSSHIEYENPRGLIIMEPKIFTYIRLCWRLYKARGYKIRFTKEYLLERSKRKLLGDSEDRGGEV